MFLDIGLVSDFLDEIEVKPLFLVVGLLLEVLPPKAGFPNFHQDHSFRPIGEPKRCFLD